MKVGYGMKLVLFILVAIVLHSLIGLYVDKLKILRKDRLTNYSLLPFSNVYMLGKYTFNWVIGFILLLILLLVSDYTITFLDKEYGVQLISEGVRKIFFDIYFIIILVVLFLAVRKYNGDTRGKDRLSFNNLAYYLKESIWIALFFIGIYLFVLFIISAGTGVISF